MMAFKTKASFIVFQGELVKQPILLNPNKFSDDGTVSFSVVIILDLTASMAGHSTSEPSVQDWRPEFICYKLPTLKSYWATPIG